MIQNPISYSAKDIQFRNITLEQRNETKCIINELKGNIFRLMREQDQTIETEKMKALNHLVTGIAHEMNSPIGTGITAASFAEAKISEILNDYHSNNLNESTFLENLEFLSKSLSLVQCNLNRAATLINRFKQTSVDDVNTQNDFITFNLSNYILETVNIEKYKEYISDSGHSIETKIEPGILLYNCPGVLSRILSILVENSVIHGFDNMDKGRITVILAEYSDHIVFTYCDNGKGIDNSLNKKIFEPFFTTKLGQNCGLGLNIVYNLVVHKMKGQIHCLCKPDHGLEIEIILNKNLSGSEKRSGYKK